MKILKIFGLVVGIHALAFMFVFAIPGCRSMSRHSPPPPAAVQAEHTAERSETVYPQNDSTSPAAQNPSSPLVESAFNPPTTSPTPSVSFPLNSGLSSGQRANPTRPGTSSPTSVRSAPSAPPVEISPAQTYVVVAGDSLSKIAKKNNVTSKELATANNLRPEAPIRLGQKLLIPGKTISVSAAPLPPAAQTSNTLVYKVRAGDSLAVIAKRAGTTTAVIKSLNHLKNDTVRAGQDLTLPAGVAASSLASPSAEPEAAISAPRGADGLVHHIVKPGENLGIIARHYGLKSGEVAVTNNIADPLKVRAGQDLVIPVGKTAGSTRSTTPTHPEPRTPTPESTPVTAPSNPVSSPADVSPVAPSPSSAPPINAATPPTIEVQEVNPIATPKA